MHISVILAHPNLNSFNHVIAQTVVNTLKVNQYTVWFHDLYAEGFDPILPYEEFPKGAPLPANIQHYCDEIATADGIVIVHPNWWGQPPAVLKGWVDRVIRPGVAYKFLEGDGGEGVPVGLLKAKVALIFNTANTPERRENEVFGDPLQLLWKNCIFDLCGVPVFYRKMYRVIVTSTIEERQAWLADVQAIVRSYFVKNA
ncbi:MAG: NAD(P)H-dependent oxidoreductase [Anaerolineae bacterium]|nr:NAD(P)H-dependent oxidoreductase [Anaerolineae bacterium]